MLGLAGRRHRGVAARDLSPHLRAKFDNNLGKYCETLALILTLGCH